MGESEIGRGGMRYESGGNDRYCRMCEIDDKTDFFFNDTATTEIYTLSLHDALPILLEVLGCWNRWFYISKFSANLARTFRHHPAEFQLTNL